MKKTQWSYFTSKEFEERCKDIEVAFLPIGACEIYGPHLPLGSDGIVAEYVAEQVAKESSGIVLPLIPVGCSKPLDDFPGTISISSRTMYYFAKEIIEDIIKWGIKKVFIIQGHLINVPVIDELIYDIKDEYPKVKFAQIDIWRFLKNNSFDIVEDEFSSKFGHACEVGTSVLMYVNEDICILDEIKDSDNDFEVDMLKYHDINSYYKYIELSKNGVLGNPSKASKKKGEVLINRLSKRIINYINDWND